MVDSLSVLAQLPQEKEFCLYVRRNMSSIYSDVLFICPKWFSENPHSYQHWQLILHFALQDMTSNSSLQFN